MFAQNLENGNKIRRILEQNCFHGDTTEGETCTFPALAGSLHSQEDSEGTVYFKGVIGTSDDFTKSGRILQMFSPSAPTATTYSSGFVFRGHLRKQRVRTKWRHSLAPFNLMEERRGWMRQLWKLKRINSENDMLQKYLQNARTQRVICADATSYSIVAALFRELYSKETDPISMNSGNVVSLFWYIVFLCSKFIELNMSIKKRNINTLKNMS